MTCVHNMANIYLRTGNHEVRVAIQEIARGFCHIIGIEHKVFFPDPPPIRDSIPQAGLTLPVGAPNPYTGVQAGMNPMGLPGLSIPGMAASPYAGLAAVNPQSDWAPDPGNPTGSKMVVVDPGPGASLAPQVPPGWQLAHPSQVPQGAPAFPGPNGWVYIPATNVPKNPALPDDVWRKVAAGAAVVTVPQQAAIEGAPISAEVIPPQGG
jgi:hypothetical protein